MEINPPKRSLKSLVKQMKFLVIRWNAKIRPVGADWKHYEEAGAQPAVLIGRSMPPAAGNRSERILRFWSNVYDDPTADLLKCCSDGTRASREGGGVLLRGRSWSRNNTLTWRSISCTTRLIQLNGQTIKVTINRELQISKCWKLGQGRERAGGASQWRFVSHISVAAHSEFQRRGNDLYCNKSVDLYTIVLAVSCSQNVEAYGQYRYSQGNTKRQDVTAYGYGYAGVWHKNEFGNLYVTIAVQLPHHLNEQELELFRKLSTLRK